MSRFGEERGVSWYINSSIIARKGLSRVDTRCVGAPPSGSECGRVCIGEGGTFFFLSFWGFFFFFPSLYTRARTSTHYVRVVVEQKKQGSLREHWTLAASWGHVKTRDCNYENLKLTHVFIEIRNIWLQGIDNV